MSDKATALADELARAAAEFAAIVAGATEAQLATICPNDGWPVVLTAYHVAVAYRVNTSWVRRLAAGEAVTATPEQIEAGNAQMVAAQTTHTREEVLGLLRENGDRLIALIRGLSDEQLALSAPFGPAGRELTTRQVIRHVVLHHVAEHVADIRAALA